MVRTLGKMVFYFFMVIIIFFFGFYTLFRDFLGRLLAKGIEIWDRKYLLEFGLGNQIGIGMDDQK
jgi:hypothetical protein